MALQIFAGLDQTRHAVTATPSPGTPPERTGLWAAAGQLMRPATPPRELAAFALEAVGHNMAARKEEGGRPRNTMVLTPKESVLKEGGTRLEDGSRILFEAISCLWHWLNADEFRATVGEKIDYENAYQILQDKKLMRFNDLPNEVKHRCAVFPLVDMEPAQPDDGYEQCCQDRQ